jgi:tetratricopeptide (TPR) repeat protein
MATQTGNIALKEGTRRDFLLSQTVTRPADAGAAAGDEQVRAALTAAFPQLLWGNRLREASKGLFAASGRFAAAAIRPDETGAAGAVGPPAAAGPGTEATLVGIATELDGDCRDAGRLWGLAQGGLLACLLPGCSAADALEWAAGFQGRVQSATGRTVTIGVAAHPTADHAAPAILDNARKAVDHAAFFGPSGRAAFDAVSLNISGDKLFERGDTAGAVGEFELALGLDPGNVNVRNSLGVCHGVLGDYDKALAQFAAALALEGQEYMAVYNIGLVNWLRGDKDKALEHLLKAHGMREDVFEILFQTGRLYMETAKPRKARKFLEQAARLRTRSAGVFRQLGDCYAALGLAEKAITAYKKAIRQNPTDPLSLSALGCLFDEKGENPEISLVFCRESVRLAPQNPLFRQRLGMLCAKQDLLAEALAELEAAAGLGLDTTAEAEALRRRMGDMVKTEK